MFGNGDSVAGLLSGTLGVVGVVLAVLGFLWILVGILGRRFSPKALLLLVAGLAIMQLFGVPNGIPVLSEFAAGGLGPGRVAPGH
ncbi:MAG: hypothetical protein ACTSU5_11245 [Promethearchaeota archaeon]